MYTLEQRMLKIYPSVVPNWALGGPKRAQEGPKWSRNRPPGVQTGPGAPKMIMRRPRWDPKQELRPPKCNPRAARCPPRGREPILGRFWGAQKGPKRRQIWDLKRDKMGTRILEQFGGRFWSVWGFENAKFQAPKATTRARQRQNARKRK